MGVVVVEPRDKGKAGWGEPRGEGVDEGLGWSQEGCLPPQVEPENAAVPELPSVVPRGLHPVSEQAPPLWRQVSPVETAGARDAFLLCSAQLPLPTC